MCNSHWPFQLLLKDLFSKTLSAPLHGIGSNNAVATIMGMCVIMKRHVDFVLQGAQKISIPYTPNKPVTVKQILR
jgi:hypothetical protein